MKISSKYLGVVIALVLASATQAFAGTSLEGSYRGESSLMTAAKYKASGDVMALLLKKDPKNEDSYYAVLAQYTRLPLTSFTVRSPITSWVNRMYAYRVDKISALEYAMRPLHVSATGEIEADASLRPDILLLKQADSLQGALIARDRGGDRASEMIEIDGLIGSTWEKYVPGNFFGTKKDSGLDYLKKDINTNLSDDGIATFNQEEVRGIFDIKEKAPGLFTLTSKSTDNLGAEKIVTKIGVFIDIVNWKPYFTTNELLLINPDNAGDVGFYYERH